MKNIQKEYLEKLPEYEGEFFLESEIGRPKVVDSLFHVHPFAFEASVSYEGGTAEGPAAILKASQQLELYDGNGYPGEAGIFTSAGVDCSIVHNQSSTELSDEAVESLMNQAETLAFSSFEMNAVPVFLGGEHSISYGPISAALTTFGDNFGIVQIDAHADLRLAYEGKVWSHASVMRRCTDKGIPLVQLGVRALCREELEYRANSNKITAFDAKDLIPAAVESIQLPRDFPENIYLTIDVDGLDPSVFPATGTPVPGGLGWYQTLSLIQSIAGQRKIIAFDLVELAPIPYLHASNFAAAQLIYNCMGMIQPAH